MSTFGSEFIGRVLGGRYRLIAPVGTGASATVFQADDVQLRRTVAVKVLHPSLAADPAFLKRFRAEAQAAAALSHPNILAVFDWGEDNGQPYLVVEFLAGGSLRSMLDVGRRLSPSQALLVGLDVARGLDYAHRRGLVHRDIKPANLLFGDDRRLRIGDFGLARALAEAAWTEPAGVVLGTARYASPEQAKGLSVDGKTDIYSLALTLFESITGQVPFAADTTVATLQNRIDKLMPVTAELGPLATIIERAGRPNRAERFDAPELGRALVQVAERLPRPEPLPIVRLHVSSERRDETMVSPPMASAPPTSDLGRPSPATRGDDLTGWGSVPAARAGASPGPGAPTTVAPRPTVDQRGPDRKARLQTPSDAAERSASTGRRIVAGIATAMTAVVLAAGVVWFFAFRDTTPSYPVLTLVGLSLDEAQNVVNPNKWQLVPTVTRLDGTTAGQIVSQDPKPSTELKRGAKINVVVSEGLPLVPVPVVSAMTETEFVAMLSSKGLIAGARTEAPSEVLAAGVMVAWSAAGETVEKGKAIDYTVSSGPAPRVLPAKADAQNKPYDEVAAALTAMQLVPSREDVFDENIAAGSVVAMSPDFGATVKRGDAVVIKVSKGPELIAVPKVIGLSVDDAVKAVQNAGLKRGSATGLAGGKVTASKPAEGEMVRKGTKVDFTTG
ncbi:MAG: PASTA domain-containing protein [Acidimicrobiia bacterium]